jgi:hypothetical protein
MTPEELGRCGRCGVPIRAGDVLLVLPHSVRHQDCEHAVRPSAPKRKPVQVYRRRGRS